MLQDTAKAIAHLKSRYPKNIALQNGNKARAKPRLPLRKTAAPVPDNDFNVESTLKVAGRLIPKSQPQMPSSPKPKNQPKTQPANAQSRNLHQTKSRNLFFSQKTPKTQHQKNQPNPTNPKDTNNFIFKGDALKRDVI